MKVSAQLREREAGRRNSVGSKYDIADIIAYCLVRKTAEGTQNANQRTPRLKKGSAATKRRIGEVEGRASHRKG